uniref:Zinc finger protein 862-like n=1 Tax=Diabrotica virgifera virgifera TaxID=50390 RepID=A0A6P7H924_DIAVI
MGIELYVKSKEDPINAVVLYDHLAQSVEKRMLSGDDAVLANCARIVDKSTWPKNIKDNNFGERDIEALADRLQVNKREAIKSFREYVFDNCRNLVGNCENNSYLENLLRLTTALNTMPISSSECERGFSQMNLIITDGKASLLTKTVSLLMFVKLNGPPLTPFEPSYVNWWLLRGRHSALDTNRKERGREET